MNGAVFQRPFLTTGNGLAKEERTCANNEKVVFSVIVVAPWSGSRLERQAESWFLPALLQHCALANEVAKT